MRRVITALVFAGAFALVIPCTSFAQRGGGPVGGFGGGRMGGASGWAHRRLLWPPNRGGDQNGNQNGDGNRSHDGDSIDLSYTEPAQTPDQHQYRQPYYDTEPAQDDTGREAYQPECVAQPAYSDSPAVATYEPTVQIIYNDGHAEMVHNYALTPTTLLVIENAAAGVSLQVPLEFINLPATMQVNRAAGVDFRLPARN